MVSLLGFRPPCVIAFLDIMIINEVFKQLLSVFSLLSCHTPATFLLISFFRLHLKITHDE